MRLRVVAFAAGCVLAGCGSEPLRAPYPGTVAQPSVQPGPQAAIVDPVRDEKIFLQRLYADSRLDPIRDKVPLQLRPDVVSSAHLRINTRPTAREKEAINAWLEVRERAQQHQLGVRGAPSLQLAKTRARVTQAIQQLRAGKMTYAAFALRIQEIDVQHQASKRQTLSSNP